MNTFVFMFKFVIIPMSLNIYSSPRHSEGVVRIRTEYMEMSNPAAASECCWLVVLIVYIIIVYRQMWHVNQYINRLLETST
jgi:hypothetical protein